MKIIKKKSDFISLFLDEKNFIARTDKATLVNVLNDELIWISNKFANYKTISKNQKEYNSITINKTWEYELFIEGISKDHNGKDRTIKVSSRKISGQDLVDQYFAAKKANK